MTFSFPLDKSPYPIDITRLRISSISANSRGSVSSGVLLFRIGEGDPAFSFAGVGDSGCMRSDIDSDGEETDIDDERRFPWFGLRRVSL